jgi:hypothetical protein
MYLMIYLVSVMVLEMRLDYISLAGVPGTGTKTIKKPQCHQININ